MSKNSFSKLLSFFALAALTALAVFGSAPDAFAKEASTFGDLLCNGFRNAKPFGRVFASISFVCGALSALRGFYGLKLHADDTKNNKLGPPLFYLLGSAALLALPSFIAAVENSLLIPSGGGMEACNAGAVHPAEGLDNVLTNFITNFKDPLLMVTSLVAILAGLLMIVRGLIKASKYGTDPRTYTPQSILTNIGFGALLMTIGDNLNLMLSTVFGERLRSSELHITKESILQWHAVNVLHASDSFGLAIASALTFVQLIGAISFVRGWLILKKVVEGGSSNETLTKGLTHIVGGVLALNISGFLDIMDKTFGTGLLH